MADEAEVLVCLERHDGRCVGTVEYREALSLTGIRFPRCDLHWAKRLAEQARINRTYPVHAPADWSPLDAGETWDEED